MVMGSLREEAELLVIGAGPGGYVAALRAADLGREVTLVEEREKLGGVCLIEGCIPSKALINVVELADSARASEQMGLSFGEPSLDLFQLRKWKDSVVEGLTGGIRSLLKRRGVQVIQGRARFDGRNSVAIEGGSVSGIEFKNCIIATGSRINKLPTGYNLPLWSSAEALTLPEVPERLLVVGGGYIGMEMGLVYAGLGSQVVMVELSPQLLMGADQDLVDVVVKNCAEKFRAVMLESKVVAVEQTDKGYAVTISHEGEEQKKHFDQVLVAIGRRPNTDDIGLEKAGLTTNDQGLIEINHECRTAVPHIFAIGDVVPGPALAHKASREAKVAAEVISGLKSAFDNRAVPAVVFTHPEIAWTGITEREASASGQKVTVGKFPLRALGRAWTMGQTDGFVKVISDPESSLLLGVGMVGPHASELIAEATLAIEMGATLEDLLVTIHPHPTLSEALMEAAEVAAGESVHINPPRK